MGRDFVIEYLYVCGRNWIRKFVLPELECVKVSSVAKFKVQAASFTFGLPTHPSLQKRRSSYIRCIVNS